jgi:hypothetical protein
MLGTASKMVQRQEAMKPEEYARMLSQAPRDGWIALSEDESRIVGSGSTMEEAVSAAAKQGVEEPVLVKSPREWGQKVL